MLLKDSDIETGIHLDFVPMVDVLFNLLIFFLLATTIAQVERETRVALPVASAAGPISASLREIIINVDAEGAIVVAGRPVEAEALADMIRGAVESNPEQKVSIRGDRATAYQNVARVLDICKAGGVQDPYLDSVME